MTPGHSYWTVCHISAYSATEMHAAHTQEAIAEAYPPTLTVTEAARVAGVSRRHAYELVAIGQIPSVRLGGAIRIPTRRFLAMIDGGGR